MSVNKANIKLENIKKKFYRMERTKKKNLIDKENLCKKIFQQNNLNNLLKGNEKLNENKTTNNNNSDYELAPHPKNDCHNDGSNVNIEESKKRILEQMRIKEDKRRERRAMEEEDNQKMEIERLEERRKIKELNDKYAEHKKEELIKSKLCLETIQEKQKAEKQQIATEFGSTFQTLQKSSLKNKQTLSGKTKSMPKNDDKKNVYDNKEKQKNKIASNEKEKQKIKPVEKSVQKKPEKIATDRRKVDHGGKAKIAGGDKSKKDQQILKNKNLKKSEVKSTNFGKSGVGRDKISTKAKMNEKSSFGKNSKLKSVGPINKAKNNKSPQKKIEVLTRDSNTKDREISVTEPIVDEIQRKESLKRSSVKVKNKGGCCKSDVKPSIEPEIVLTDVLPPDYDKMDEVDTPSKSIVNQDQLRGSIKLV